MSVAVGARPSRIEIPGRAPEEQRRAVVWIVDDNPADARRVAEAIGDFADGELFGDGGSLLERAASGALPDALLLDWRLPAMSGLEVCRYLRNLYHEGDLPILMVTAIKGFDEIAEAMAAGATDYITKPFDPVELRARLGAAIRIKRLFQRAHQAELALAEERSRLFERDARFRSLSDSGILGIVHMDLVGSVVDANDAFLSLLGIPRSRLAGGFRIRDVTPAEYHDADERAYTELIACGACSRYEKELITSTGDRVMVLQAAALLPEEPRRAIAYMVDVTEQRRLEADRKRLYDAERKARAAAEAASSMKDEFLAVVSHELRTPLNSILGWAQLAHSSARDPVLISRAIDTIERNARTQAKLIDDILDVSRIITGKVRFDFASIDLKTIVDDVVDGMRPTADAKHLELVWRSAIDSAPLSGDASRLQQVVFNLVTNAIKFTPRGTIVIELDALEEWYVLTIRDTGIGIRPEFLPHVFDRFRQADASTTRSHGGLGLGLSIVRSLVELHGGRVWVESEGEGHGARFGMELPRAATVESVEPSPPMPDVVPSVPPLVDEAALRGARILVVDDETDAREFTAFTLQARGADVAIADSVHAALATLQQKGPFDIVLSDIAMPNEDGFQLADRVRKLAGLRPKLVALSAHARSVDVAGALQRGFDMHIAKPVDAQRLVQRLAALLAR